MTYTGEWNIDMSRAAQEGLPPNVYLSVSYYHRWALGIEKNALEKGLIGADEVAAGRALRPGKPVKRTMTKEKIGAAFTRGSFGRPTDTTPRFMPGDRVRTKNMNPVGHTRLPRYARDRVGLVEAVRGCHVYPDAVTAGRGEDPQWLYTVVFTSRELWGPEADPRLTVSIEAFEPYLDPA
jgi:nitrile hydratase